MTLVGPVLNTVTISNAENLGYSRRSGFFGGSIPFKRVITVTVQAVTGNITNNGSVVSQISDLFDIRDKNDYSYLTINGKTVGQVKITGFTLPSSTFSTTASCTVTFEKSEGDQDLTSIGADFLDYESAFSNSSLVKSISESINISRGENTISYSKEISIQFGDELQLQSSEEPLVKEAQRFAKDIFETDESSGYSYLTTLESEADIRALLDGGYKKFRSESLNLITNECSFSEKLTAQNIVSSGIDYSHSATQSISINQIGVFEVSERGKIQGLIEPRMEGANHGYEEEVARSNPNIYDRLAQLAEDTVGNRETQGSKNDFSQEPGCDADVPGFFTIIRKTINSFEGVIEYEATTTNDPKYENHGGGVMYEYEQSVQRTEQGFYFATERGSISGLSSTIYDSSQDGLKVYPKYREAVDFYETVSSSIDSRTKGLIDNPSSFPTTRTETHNPFQGTMSYERTFSNDPKFASQSDGIKTITRSATKNSGVSRKNDFAVLNRQVVVQERAGRFAGSENSSVSLVGYRLDPKHQIGKGELGNLLSLSKREADEVLEEDRDFINSASYSYSYLNNVTLGLNVGFHRDLKEEE